MNNNKNLINGLLAVGAIAGVAYLISSGKGTKIKDMLMKKGMDVADDIKDKMNRYKEEAKV
jgi:gas vesicle protein